MNRDDIKVTYTTLFGRPYMWIREGKKLRLQPDYSAGILFPKATQRNYENWMKGNK